MRRIQCQKLEQEHLFSLLREVRPDEDEATHRRMALTKCRLGPGFAFTCDHGRLIACGGVTVYWEGMGEVWLVISDHAKVEHKLELVMWTKWGLDQIQAECKLRRLQADVLASDAGAISFVKHFGFKLEGLMRSYDALGRDAFRYARIREVNHD